MSEKEAKRREAAMFQKNTILINENDKLKKENEYARSLLRSLLDNTDEYARQRAEEYLKEEA